MVGFRKATVGKANGYTVSTGKLGVVEHDTLMCCHCGQHWQYRPGSGITRGWCSQCMGPICGPKCQEHFPLEKRFDLYEKGAIKEFTDSIEQVIPPHQRIILS
jgi:hypothetical protein